MMHNWRHGNLSTRPTAPLLVAFQEFKNSILVISSEQTHHLRTHLELEVLAETAGGDACVEQFLGHGDRQPGQRGNLRSKFDGLAQWVGDDTLNEAEPQCSGRIETATV